MFLNAPAPIDLTVPGKTIDSSFTQFVNAPVPIASRVLLPPRLKLESSEQL